MPLPDLRPGLPTVADILANASEIPDPARMTGRSLGTGPAPDPTGPLAADAVDQAVEILEQPPLRYPRLLAQAGIPGRVEIEFVVDTLGRAEPASLRMLGSARTDFEAAARVAVLGTRFRPASWHGRPVRQLVRQALSFRAEPRR
jgi:TonB family protein